MYPNPNQPQQNNQKLPNCVRCQIAMQPLMQMPVRVGGPKGGFVFFREFQEMDERILILDTFRCPQCRTLEFFDLDMSLPQC